VPIFVGAVNDGARHLTVFRGYILFAISVLGLTAIRRVAGLAGLIPEKFRRFPYVLANLLHI